MGNRDKGIVVEPGEENSLSVLSDTYTEKVEVDMKTDQNITLVLGGTGKTGYQPLIDAVLDTPRDTDSSLRRAVEARAAELSAATAAPVTQPSLVKQQATVDVVGLPRDERGLIGC